MLRFVQSVMNVQIIHVNFICCTHSCGESPGGVLPNFYDGSRCVSVTFILIMAAGVGGLLIFSFMFAVIGMAVEHNKKEKNALNNLEAIE